VINEADRHPCELPQQDGRSNIKGHPKPGRSDLRPSIQEVPPRCHRPTEADALSIRMLGNKFSRLKFSTNHNYLS
jgi:hypothetical protein